MTVKVEGGGQEPPLLPLEPELERGPVHMRMSMSTMLAGIEPDLLPSPGTWLWLESMAELVEPGTDPPAVGEPLESPDVDGHIT